MSNSVIDLVKSCDPCQRVEGCHTKAGLLQYLPVPEQLSANITMHFIMASSLTCRGNSGILTVVDRITKHDHLAER